MAIKLYNKTRCPDEILRPIITAAGQRIGAKTDVVVKVMGPCNGFQGCACRGFPYLWHLTRKRQKGENRHQMIGTNCGWIVLHIPRVHPADDPLERAERFYRLCLHEWGHIKDFQDQERGEHRPFCDYNKRWANRPHEQRAVRMESEAQDTYYSHTAEEAILALAMWLEKETN